ncbi:hypothetical protein T492DRAFT_960161 [Pavlovales sp. CCMP2436]|nr:hypothetical protein T492DRAFT_960161 [Pavlovales sp. CCMP2436]
MSFTPVTAAEISEEFRAELGRVQQTRALSEDAAEFRSYLVQQGVAEEVAISSFRLTTSPPLKAKHEQLGADVEELEDILRGLQLDKWGPQLSALAAAHGGSGEGGEAELFDARALLVAAQTAAVEKAVAAGARPPSPENRPPAADAPPAEPVPCSIETLQEWALAEFDEVATGGAVESSLGIFVRALRPQALHFEAETVAAGLSAEGAAGVAAAEAEAAAVRAARLLARARAKLAAAEEPATEPEPGADEGAAE